MSIPVVNSTVFQDNPYQRLLYSALEGRYNCIRGGVEDAFALLADQEGPALLHLHWEEHALRIAPSAAEARLLVRHIAGRLAAFRASGGRILWTLHNAAPHEGEHLAEFLWLRRSIARFAHLILVHSTDAVTLLEEQVGPLAEKLFLLPHPSYLGVYEPEGTPLGVAGRSLLCFGKLRGYKRLDRVLDMLTEEFLATWDARLRISGEGDAGAVVPRARVDWDLRRVPDAELGALFRGARAVVLDYEQPLSSGVALLALSFGRPLLAPRRPGLLELLPREAHGFLFEPGSAEDARRAAGELLGMTQTAHAALAEACLARAAEVHPRRISAILGDVYDVARAMP